MFVTPQEGLHIRHSFSVLQGFSTSFGFLPELISPQFVSLQNKLLRPAGICQEQWKIMHQEQKQGFEVYQQDKKKKKRIVFFFLFYFASDSL